MKKLIITITSLIIIGCGSSGDSAVNTANSNPVEDNPKFEIIFKEGFENTPDWVSSSRNPNGDLKYPVTNNPPLNWDHVRSAPKWSPSVGHNDRLEPVSIKEHDPIMVRTGKKSAVFARDASHDPEWMWMSDGIIGKTFNKDYKQLYVEFYMRYRPDSAQYRADLNKPNEEIANLGKIARILAWDREGPIMHNFAGAVNKPEAGYTYGINGYGARHMIALRGHPTTGETGENNERFKPYIIPDLPRALINGSMSLNYSDNIRDLNGDGKRDNEITTFLSATDDKPIGHHGGIITPVEMWGDTTTKPIWRKFAFFVKMNSKPGAMDGVYKIWIDDNLIFSNSNIPWIGHASPTMKGWNSIKLGGNDYIKGKIKPANDTDPPVYIIPDSLRYQDWYAIDDIMVATAIPEHLKK